MDDLLSEFLTETNEALALLDLELVKLEQNPNDPGLLGNIFRLVHTIKGTCGFLGLPRLEAVAHASENVLGKFRDGEQKVTPHAVTLILASLDQIKSLLAQLEANEAEPAGEDSELIARLNALAAGDTGAAAAPAAAKPAAPAPEAAKAPAPVLAKPIIDPVPEPAPVAPPVEAAPVAAASGHKEPKVKEPKEAKEPRADVAEAKESAVAAQSIRVNVDLLENLMTMVSELVLTRNQLMQILRGQKDSEFGAPLQRLSHVTTELQEGVMKTRMQPIGNAWTKLPRIVRDLSHELRKKIELQMLGAETELDRQVLELIKDPLTHMVRNSADHGIEMPAERAGGGKPETGTITLNAFHEGGHIIIEIADDGRGLDIDKIKQKAIATGLATEGDLAAMTEAQIQQFIFRAGFSTAAKVTSVSGRGVGMDVVRTNIEKIGGTVEMKSHRGKGSTFVIKIPLTLAIVSALIVECAGERFAIPQISVVELVRAAANSENKIEWLNNAPVLRLQGPAAAAGVAAGAAEARQAHRPFGRDLHRRDPGRDLHLRHHRRPGVRHRGNRGEAGGAHPARHHHVLRQHHPWRRERDHDPRSQRHRRRHGRDHGQREREGEGRRGGGEGRQGHRPHQPAAVPCRLGRAQGGAAGAHRPARGDRPGDKIEYSHDKPVVQYRGKLMPLVTIDPDYQMGKEGRQPILVFADKEHTMGLVVDEIVDIVEDQLKIEVAVDRPGLIGSAIISGKATDLIDAGFYLTKAFTDWFGAHADGEFAADKGKRVLLVDDSPFFRNLLTPLLSVAGYDVTTVESADRALALCEAGNDFDVIISDIEMPGMDGFQFASAVQVRRPLAEHAAGRAVVACHAQGSRPRACGGVQRLCREVRSRCASPHAVGSAQC